MTRVAFYAPMKPVDHPNPSGDRRMARLFMKATEVAYYDVEIASFLQIRDRAGDDHAQTALIAHAAEECKQLITRLHSDPPDIWFTYHCYYKAPDLLGPALSRHFDIPYVIAEATRAKKRLGGPWDRFARCAESAIDSAHLLLAMTPHDRFALDRDKNSNQQVVDFSPFLDAGPQPAPKTPSTVIRLLCVAMMREGDKLESYKQLAHALPLLERDWTLTIIGDGAAHSHITTLFEAFRERVYFVGMLDQTELRSHYESADIVVWPGVNEAYGMVYLEAQAAGTPVIAQDWPGPRAVVGAGSQLVPPNNPQAFAEAITAVAADVNASQSARDYIVTNHTLDAAAQHLAILFGELL